MALSPPFVCANLRVAKIKVNVFLRPRRFFLDALVALALPRARRFANRAARRTRAKSRVIQRFARACALTSKEVHRRGAEDAEGRNLNLRFWNPLRALCAFAVQSSPLAAFLVTRTRPHKMFRFSLERIPRGPRCSRQTSARDHRP